uniref:Uncharacterized protein n=1 Tax=Nelumbo nucifera TaxID=4432 RepID=A0A822XUK4_NELNU|nr:TPA_asm: hypothetical protein HUJ06_025513 [Nelumbo nucifera]
MSLCCLSGEGSTMTEPDSEFVHEQVKPRFRLCCIGVERSWSGSLTPPPYNKIMRSESPTEMKNNRKKGHRRIHSTGAVAFGMETGTGEPRLLRSGGMRRDWSFEDLTQTRIDEGREY